MRPRPHQEKVSSLFPDRLGLLPFLPERHFKNREDRFVLGMDGKPLLKAAVILNPDEKFLGVVLPLVRQSERAIMV